jgi:tetratricopeptide (TPR) repeat protein
MAVHEHHARGTPVPDACGGCGAGVTATARFCSACGVRLGAPEGAAAVGRNVDALLLAQEHIDAGRLPAAIGALETLCSADPDWTAARISLGIAYLRSGRIHDAEDALSAAETSEPRTFSCELAWAEYQARLGFYDRAVTRLDRALALEAPSLRAHTTAVELRRHCRERAKHLYYREAIVPRWMSWRPRHTANDSTTHITATRST